MQTMYRILKEADNYLDIDDIADYFLIRGRPTYKELEMKSFES